MQIRSMRVAAILAVVAAGFAGCDNIKVVTRNSSCDGGKPCTTQVPGIPFLARVPVLTQETKWSRDGIEVQIEITTHSIPAVTKDLPDFPLLVLDSSDVQDAIGVAQRAFAALGPPAKPELETILKTSAQQLDAIQQADKNGRDANHTRKEEMVENTWTIDSVLGSRQYYISTKQPVFGSATTDFKLGADGTLSEASATVEDTTATTLLSLLPVADFLRKSWGLTPTSGDAAATALSLGPGHKVPAAPPKISVTLLVKPQSLIYTLRKQTVVGADEPLGAVLRGDCGDKAAGDVDIKTQNGTA